MSKKNNTNITHFYLKRSERTMEYIDRLIIEKNNNRIAIDPSFLSLNCE